MAKQPNKARHSSMGQLGKPWRRHSSFTPRQSPRDLGILPLHKAPGLGVPRCDHQRCKHLGGLCRFLLGALVLLTTPHCSEVNTKANLIDWRSNSSSRVCRSTLASEAIACDDCVDRTYFSSFSNLMLAELLTGDRPKKDLSSWRLNELQVTDCKSLFDAVTAEHPKTTEKRTYVDIRSLQEFI